MFTSEPQHDRRNKT